MTSSPERDAIDEKMASLRREIPKAEEAIPEKVRPYDAEFYESLSTECLLHNRQRCDSSYSLRHCVCNFCDVAKVGAAASPEDVEPRQALLEFGILLSEFDRVSVVEQFAFI
jgi:hypothetical protein